MPTLDKKNLKSAISDIAKKGYRTKFWRDHRASAAKGSGVGKIMDQLEKLGLPASGDPKKVNEIDNMPEIVTLLSSLSNAMLKAEGKCGKLQGETKEFCTAYRKHIRTIETEATKLAQNIDKIKQAKMAAVLRQEKYDQEELDTLAKFKSDKVAKDKLMAQELLAINERAKRIDMACKDIINDTDAGIQDIEKIKTAWKTQHGKEGADRASIEAKANAALEALTKKYKIPAHAKNIKDALPKLFKEATTTFKQFNTIDDLKKGRMAAGKSLASAQGHFKEAQDGLKFFLVQHKIALEEVQAARPEGV